MTPIELRRLIGERIRFLRKAQGWTQEELGEYAALSYKFIGEIERGVVNPSLDTLLGISNALQVEIVKLFSSERMCVLTGSDITDVQAALTTLNNVLSNQKPNK